MVYKHNASDLHMPVTKSLARICACGLQAAVVGCSDVAFHHASFPSLALAGIRIFVHFSVACARMNSNVDCRRWINSRLRVRTLLCTVRTRTSTQIPWPGPSTDQHSTFNIGTEPYGTMSHVSSS
eukprot:scaffold270778_cov14-Prasinocladus_malaysianus.AAC.1